MTPQAVDTASTIKRYLHSGQGEGWNALLQFKDLGDIKKQMQCFNLVSDPYLILQTTVKRRF